MDLMPWMQQQGMLPAAGETVLCAVSGGRDSVCLLHYLASLGRRRGFAVAAAHYNHLMRPTAGRDEAFVAGLCRELSVPLYVERGDVRAIARQEGWGVEEAGRRLRYDFLERTADAIGASRIATAHHLSDQAETVVLNLLRGTGPEGLAGIPPVRGRLIRPLLQTRHLVPGLPFGGEDDDGNAAALIPQGAAHVKAVHFRQHDVQQN